MPLSTGPILDPKVNAVIERMEAAERRPGDGDGRRGNRDGGNPHRGPRGHDGRSQRDPFAFAHRGFSIQREQGELIYLLCRMQRATRIVEFATSVGMSTVFFAAALRDNGGGKVIGAELVPEKVATARRNLAEAGLADFADIREGDARETLRDLGGPVDFVLIDGWPGGDAPSLARQVTDIVAPQLRIGGIMMNDNGEEDYLAFIRDPANGYRSMSLPLKNNTELSVKVA
jgi:hypothetical protein